jgi:hypothetical protein
MMVPEATSDGSQRISIQSSVSFDDALELVHKTIGCVSVQRKPTLAYKLSTATQKALTVNPRSTKNWEGLVTDVLLKA